MPQTLFALQDDNGTLLCASCADSEYEGDYPTDTTPVFVDDHWREKVHGECKTCHKTVDGKLA